MGVSFFLTLEFTASFFLVKVVLLIPQPSWAAAAGQLELELAEVKIEGAQELQDEFLAVGVWSNPGDNPIGFQGLWILLPEHC